MKRLLILCLLTLACHREPAAPAQAGSPQRGRQLIDRYGCAACHSIPGVAGAKGMVGPPLAHIGSRTSIGGRFPNTAETMARWLQNPQAMAPESAMPNLGVSASDSRDIAAYLETLR